MPPLPTIACKECGHVNEGERIYCHNCGSKLDRSVLLTVKQQNETPEQKRRRIQKAMSPTAGLGRGLLIAFLQAAPAGALAALVLDMVLPPPTVPAVPKKGDFEEIVQLDLALENMAAGTMGMRPVSMKEAEINNYLKSKVRPKYDGNFFQSATSFQRAFVKLTPGDIQISMQTAILDYPLYFSIHCALRIDSIHSPTGEVSQGVVSTPISANIGRLYLPPAIVQFSGFVFDPLWNALNREHRLVDHVGEIEIRRGEIIFSAHGPRPAGTEPFPTTSSAQPTGLPRNFAPWPAH